MIRAPDDDLPRQLERHLVAIERALIAIRAALREARALSTLDDKDESA